VTTIPRCHASVKVKPYWERIKLREIEKSNKRLLTNVIRMEKDFLNLKKTLTKKFPHDKDIGMRPEHLSATMQTNMLRSFYHTTQNRKNTYNAINKENTRIFSKLSKL